MPVSFDVRRFAEIDSTNTWVLAQARAGAPEGLVAVADHQTAGRGRLGRVWEAPAGANLLATVLLRPAVVSYRSLACVALAGRDAAAAFGSSPGIKWPNDLVVEGPGRGKLAGVLAETDGAGAVAVGIGMNVGWAPPEAARLDDGVSRDDVLDAWLAALGLWLDRSDREVASAYRSACVTLGREVRVDLVDGSSFEGTAADVDDDGRLLVEVDACLRTVDVADVVHLR
ncbi:MAG TPA: biotin--[acetyl-CoA-carboxylase] ligase [Acidimicrobiales bacterium]|nr:biotin--[acetyl-CoA-carboxylase] ligase [Acidimicrobiales bacterium]